jgi:FkbM family methyltransferase
MKLTSIAKDWLTRAGLRIYRTSNLPRGFDVFCDLKSIGITPRVILDVGANVGQFARAARKAFPGSIIHCFEPVEATYRELEALTKTDGLIHTRRTAMGAQVGTQTIHLRSNSAWNSLSRFNNDPANSDGCSERVSINTIDIYCSENGIKAVQLLKTDTEGYDLKVLLGADTILREGLVSAVYSEVTLLESDHTHTQFREVSSHLEKYGFVTFALYEFAGDHQTMHANALFVRRQTDT